MTNPRVPHAKSARIGSFFFYIDACAGMTHLVS